MKTKLLPMAIGAILAAQFGAAHAAEVQVYGKANWSVNSYDNEYWGADQKSNDQLNSNASRVGVKGDLNITEDLKAVYRLEYTVFLDDGSSNSLSNTSSDSSTFQARNNFGGLKSATYGQIVAGKNDTPFKLIQNSDLDRFNDLDQGDMQNYLIGEDRVNNMVMYTSPLMSGFTVNLQTYTNEESGEDVTFPTAAENDDSTFEHNSMSVTYDVGGPLYAGVAYNDDVGNADSLRAMASYKITDNIQIAGLVQTAEVADSNNDNDALKEDYGDGINLSSGILNTVMGANTQLGPTTATAPATNNSQRGSTAFNTGIESQDGWMANVMWTIVPNKWVTYVQYGQSTSTLFDSVNMNRDLRLPLTTSPIATYVAQDADFDSKFWGVGADYILSKKVKVFGYYTDQQVDIDDSKSLVVLNNIDDASLKTAGVGLEIKF